LKNQKAVDISQKKLSRNVVELLESIPDLRDKIEQDRADIEDMKREKFDATTWHEAGRPEGPQLDDETRHMQKIRNRERGMLRTQQLLNRIENALKKLESDPDYPILRMRYLEGMTNEQVAEKLFCSNTTLWRRQKKLIRKLERKLFGADAF
jgi:RNA polymerase sigma factor (sigma-70 family)